MNFSISFKLLRDLNSFQVLSMQAFRKLFNYLISLSHNLNIVGFIIQYSHFSYNACFHNANWL
jgi:dimeric dUTPase (all-alpha-NTP-PPase superfamily)